MAFLKIDTTSRYLLWTIDRPERMNAIGTTIAQELRDAAQQLDHDLASSAQGPSSLVITARPVERRPRRGSANDSPAIWIGGGDLKELTRLDAAGGRAYAALMAGVIAILSRLPIPVLIAVDGVAIGGGAELVLAGDLRLGTARSALDFRQLQVGLATGYGTTSRMVDLIGLAHAQRLLLTSAHVEAAEAHGLGLFHRVLADGAALQRELEELTTRLAAVGPQPLAAQKLMLAAATASHPGSAAATELELFARLWRNPQHSAYLDAFAKRDLAP